MDNYKCGCREVANNFKRTSNNPNEHQRYLLDDAEQMVIKCAVDYINHNCNRYDLQEAVRQYNEIKELLR